MQQLWQGRRDQQGVFAGKWWERSCRPGVREEDALGKASSQAMHRAESWHGHPTSALDPRPRADCRREHSCRVPGRTTPALQSGHKPVTPGRGVSMSGPGNKQLSKLTVLLLRCILCSAPLASLDASATTWRRRARSCGEISAGCRHWGKAATLHLPRPSCGSPARYS